MKSVPGENPLRGVVELQGEVIAFRDEGEKCGVFISSNEGWSAAPLSYWVKLKDVVKPENLLNGRTNLPLIPKRTVQPCPMNLTLFKQVLNGFLKCVTMGKVLQ